MSRDRAFLGHMLQALERVSTLAAEISEDDLASDWKKQNALIRELEVLGEAAGRVSTDFVAAHPEIPWKEITGLRHKLMTTSRLIFRSCGTPPRSTCRPSCRLFRPLSRA